MLWCSHSPMCTLVDASHSKCKYLIANRQVHCFCLGCKTRHACPCNWHLCRRLAGSENTIYFIYWSGFSPASCSVTTVLAWVTSVIGHHGLGFGHLVPALCHHGLDFGHNGFGFAHADLVFVGYGFDLCQHGPAFCDHSWYHCCW